MNANILLTLFIFIPFFGLNGCGKTPGKDSNKDISEDKKAPKAALIEMTPEERAYYEESERRRKAYEAKTPEQINEEVKKLELKTDLGPPFEKPKEPYEAAKKRGIAEDKAKAAEFASRAEKAPQIIIDIFADAIKRISSEPGQDLVNKLKEILSNTTSTNILIQNLRKQAGISSFNTDEELRKIISSKRQRNWVESQPTISRTMREVMGSMHDIVKLNDGIVIYVKNRDDARAKEFMQLLIDAILNTDGSA